MNERREGVKEGKKRNKTDKKNEDVQEIKLY